MKIDKIIFSCSEQYSDFWNIISKIYKTYLNIEPVCLLFGDIKNTDMHEKYGYICNIPYIDYLPKVLQITWSKFLYTKTEPETTWMIGDIDQLPLNKFWFTDNIEDINNEHYVHLNSSACAENRGYGIDGWLKGLCDLPAHYHIAKGSTFKNFLTLEGDLEYEICNLVKNKVGNIENLKKINDETSFFWCEEEHVTSKRLFEKYNSNKIHLFSYNNTANKICRSRFDFQKNDYLYDTEKLKNKKYIDIHCERPYKKTETQINNILNIAWG